MIPSSVEPYTSKRNPSPSFSMISCFSAYGTGAAFAIRQRIDERSACASSSSGRLTTRLSWVGAENVFVARVQLHRGEPRDRVEPAEHDDRRAQRVVDGDEGERTRVVHRPGGDVHLVAELQAEVHITTGPMYHSGPLAFVSRQPHAGRADRRAAALRPGRVARRGEAARARRTRSPRRRS